MTYSIQPSPELRVEDIIERIKAVWPRSQFDRSEGAASCERMVETVSRFDPMDNDGPDWFRDQMKEVKAKILASLQEGIGSAIDCTLINSDGEELASFLIQPGTGIMLCAWEKLGSQQEEVLADRLCVALHGTKHAH